jgi:hypothetical protein
MDVLAQTIESFCDSMSGSERLSPATEFGDHALRLQFTKQGAFFPLICDAD